MRVKSINNILDTLKTTKRYAEAWDNAKKELELREVEIAHQYAMYYCTEKEEGNTKPLSIIKWLEKRKLNQKE
jgi:hypothetical protein|tara:strand:- start:109 stop:327 length:219 start_codon:yes stop_codon:yes gene_type:complete